MSRISGFLFRATDRLFAHGGEEAVLRGVEPVSVILATNVEIYGDQGIVEQFVTTATFRDSAAPRPRDRLTVLTGPHAGEYTLDRPIERRGAAGRREWILLPANPAPPGP